MTKLKSFLKERQLNLRTFAAEVGVDPSVLSRFSNGRAWPSLDTAFAIERASNGEVPASSFMRTPPPEEHGSESANAVSTESRTSPKQEHRTGTPNPAR